MLAAQVSIEPSVLGACDLHFVKHGARYAKYTTIWHSSAWA